MGSCFKVGGYCTFIIVLLGILGQLYLQYGDQREFNRNTTAEIAATNTDFTGKVAIVTGANTGIGKPTARVLLSHGATVIMGCRNKAKAERAKQDIINDLTDNNFKNLSSDQLSNNLDIIILDLASLQSIKQFTTAFTQKYDKLNYLILNAGLLNPSWKATDDGIEQTFGVNHVGHFYLTQLLNPILIQTASALNIISRVIVVSSEAHNVAPNPMEPWLKNDNMIQDESEYGMLRLYGFSKACNILFSNEYNERYSDKNVYAVSLHPGGITTELGRNLNPMIRSVMDFFRPLIVMYLKTPSQGAATTIRTLSLSDDEFKQYGGDYFVDCNVANNKLRSDMNDKSNQDLLWKLTENILNDKLHK